MDSLLHILSSNIKENYLLILFFVPFVGGVLSSLSPCTLGILPLIVGYIGGYSEEKNLKTLIQMISFVFGLSFVLSFVGVLCAFTGRVFASFSSPVFVLVLAGLILIFGLNLIGVLELNFPVLVKSMPQNKNNNIIIFPFLIGMIFAFASTPCSTPILASIMAIATLSKNIFNSAIMLFSFSLGQGLIIIVAGLFTSALKNLKSFAKYSHYLTIFCGYMLILASLLIYFKIFSIFFV